VAGDVEAPLDAAFVEAMRAVLREPSLDPAFKALVLTPPSEIYIAEQLDSVDPQRVHAGARSDEAAARDRPRRRLAVGVRCAPGQRRLLARSGLVRAGAHWPTSP
jgi:hypothetical protein